jgi:aarF domain-containing kinase
MKAVLLMARRHRVTVDSAFASLVISVCVLAGFATGLDPGVNLADPCVVAMLAHSLTGRLVGRLYAG